MLTHFLSACALLFVLEGIIPFTMPQQWKTLLQKIIDQDERMLRISGFISMLVGVALLTIVHQFAD